MTTAKSMPETPSESEPKMSYRNPSIDSHGNDLNHNAHQRYRLYFRDGGNRLAVFCEGDDCETLVRIGDGDQRWERFDEMDVKAVVPVDAHGLDLPQIETEIDAIALLQVDLTEIANLQARIHRIVTSAAKRFGLADDRGDYFFADVEDNFRVWMTSGDPASSVMRQIETETNSLAAAILQDHRASQEHSVA